MAENARTTAWKLGLDRPITIKKVAKGYHVVEMTKLVNSFFLKINGTVLGQSSKEHAMKKAEGVSTLPSRAATQIAVYQGSVANHKVVAVYLNGSKLPRSAWFVGFKR